MHGQTVWTYDSSKEAGCGRGSKISEHCVGDQRKHPTEQIATWQWLESAYNR